MSAERPTILEEGTELASSLADAIAGQFGVPAIQVRQIIVELMAARLRDEAAEETLQADVTRHFQALLGRQPRG